MTETIKERPILFSGPMVRAILAGRKTQTRRVLTIKHAKRLGLDTCGDLLVTSDGPQWDGTFEGGRVPWCPYGKPGDRLWVRESLYVDDIHCIDCPPSSWPQTGIIKEQIYYRADGDCCKQIPECSCAEVGKPRWIPSIHMPRWASRITLEITGVRVERLQEISEADAIAEGVTPIARPLDDPGDCWTDGTHRTAYQYLWNEINGWNPNAWAANPFVWVIEFRRVEQ